MKRDGFTLLEMMIVVVLIAIIYSLLLSKQKKVDQNLTLDIAHPYRALLYRFWDHNHLSIVCEDRCKECFVYEDQKRVIKEIKPIFDKNNTPKVYIFSDNGSIKRADFIQLDPKQADKRVCFRYDLYGNGSSTEMLLEYKDKVVYLPPYFDNQKIFSSMQKAQEYLDNLKMEISR